MKDRRSRAGKSARRLLQYPREKVVERMASTYALVCGWNFLEKLAIRIFEWEITQFWMLARN